MKKNFIIRVLNFLKYRIMPPHNMLTHKAEKFYFEEYMHYISRYFVKGKDLLDIGCQMGRFAIPAALTGANVVATDIRKRYFHSISKIIDGRANIAFRHETLNQSVNNLPHQKFDVVLCLELLYNLPDPETNIKKLALLLKPGGYLITSHRTPGYYMYRFIREKNFDSVSQILTKTHPDYNAQTAGEIKAICEAAGLKPLKIVPIGIFSGFGSDAFSGIANPAKMSEKIRKQLFLLETNPELMRLFENSARYNLLIAQRPDLATSLSG
ncbi:MAG: methyltransferase domain-containing protein [Lentimicrobium sp.]|nr:methyltransferase domain-containing protein [Lentimicrobium sp.]